MKKALLITLGLFMSFPLLAQRPNMHIKAKVGTHTMTFIDKNDAKETNFFYGIQGGFGFRVMQKKKMFEIGFDFNRSFITLPGDTLGNTFIQLNSFEVPVIAGITAINKPLYKHFFYGGFATRFNIKSYVSFDDLPDLDPVFVKPRDLFLTSPAVAMRLGTQLDIAMFNIDFNYNLGLNKAAKENTRVQSHNVQFNIGVLF